MPALYLIYDEDDDLRRVDDMPSYAAIHFTDRIPFNVKKIDDYLKKLKPALQEILTEEMN